MPPAAATAAGRARKTRAAETPRSGSGRPPSGRRSGPSGGQYVDEFRVTDRRSKGSYAPSGRASTAAAAATATPPVRPSRQRRDRTAAAAQPVRKRREVHVKSSSETSAFDRVLGSEPRRGARSSRVAAPEPLMMAPRRRLPRMDTGIFSVPAGMSGAVALPRPHIGRPAFRRPRVHRPTVTMPHFSRAAASQQLDRLIRSRLWIAVLGVMLVGIVGMRVEVLKLGTKTGSAVQMASQLQAENAIEQAKLSRLDNPGRITRLAEQAGLHQPGVTASKFLTADDPRNLDRALHGITAPNATRFAAGLASGADASSTADQAPVDSAGTTDASGTVTTDAPTSSDQ
jgi:hypothetical protein